MRDEQQAGGGAIWNVRALVGDLADELTQEQPAEPAPERADRATEEERSTPGAQQPTPVSFDERVRSGWVGDGAVLRRPSGISTRKVIMAAVLTLLVAFTVVGVVAGTQGEDSSGASYPEYPAQPRYDPPAGQGEPPTHDPTTFGATETSEPPWPDPEAGALAQLSELNRQDLPTVSLDGRYAAQLASKAVGIVDPNQTAANGSHTFYAEDILAEHLRLRETFSGEERVVLLLSTDYGRQQLYGGQPLWITFAVLPGRSKQAAARWCAAQFPHLTGSALDNQCVPRRLRPPGST